jgi:ribosomal protein S18 acetylase RimI-like enzyme
MEKFITLVDNKVVATQIAELINKHNNLKIIHTDSSILESAVQYVIEQRYVNDTLVVIGCIGIKKDQDKFCTIQHLCVKEGYRNQGIATKLLNAVSDYADAEYVKASVRHDNMASLKLLKKLKFTAYDCLAKDDYFILKVSKKLK